MMKNNSNIPCTLEKVSFKMYIWIVMVVICWNSVLYAESEYVDESQDDMKYFEAEMAKMSHMGTCSSDM